MAQVEARKATLVGGGLTTGSRLATLVFAWENKERFALAIELRQFLELLKVAALTHTQARKLDGDKVPPIPVETWSTTATPDDTAILSLKVFGGLELRFEVSPNTQEESGQSP